MISRLDVLKQIDDLLVHQCTDCEIRKELYKTHVKVFSKIDGFCNKECATGKQLQGLGKAMDRETKLMRKDRCK